jgi:hypothetical protein
MSNLVSTSTTQHTTTLTLKLNPNPMRHALHTLRPKRLVQLGINPHVLSAHRLLRELDDGLDGVRCALFE